MKQFDHSNVRQKNWIHSFVFWKNRWLEKKHYDFVWPLGTSVCILRATLFDTLISDKKTLNRGKSVSGLLSFYELKIVLVLCSSTQYLLNSLWHWKICYLPTNQFDEKNIVWYPHKKAAPRHNPSLNFSSKIILNFHSTQCLTSKIVTSHILLVTKFRLLYVLGSSSIWTCRILHIE